MTRGDPQGSSGYRQINGSPILTFYQLFRSVFQIIITTRLITVDSLLCLLAPYADNQDIMLISMKCDQANPNRRINYLALRHRS